MEKYILFGAGGYGKKALEDYGKDKVEFFLDNDVNKKGQTIDGVEIRLFSEWKENVRDRKIIVCVWNYHEIIEEFKLNGIKNYAIYDKALLLTRYGNPNKLITNPYENNKNRDLSESDYVESHSNVNSITKARIEYKVEEYAKTNHMFHHIEIETINRCNMSCEFCPVNKNVDSREKKIMDEKLFKKIIDELADMNYSGRIALFSNNEPLLDDRIMEFHRYTRKKLPNARMHLFTNGTLMTLDIFKELAEILDELIIDNYNQDLKLIKPCEEIVEYCKEHPELIEKVTIDLRKPKEILTSRGGDAPNRKQKYADGTVKCILPFQQLVIRPDGKVSLCCNDPLGKCTLGDLSKESILDVWNGEPYKMVRNALINGRENFEHCKYCDTYYVD